MTSLQYGELLVICTSTRLGLHASISMHPRNDRDDGDLQKRIVNDRVLLKGTFAQNAVVWRPVETLSACSTQRVPFRCQLKSLAVIVYPTRPLDVGRCWHRTSHSWCVRNMAELPEETDASYAAAMARLAELKARPVEGLTDAEKKEKLCAAAALTCNVLLLIVEAGCDLQVGRVA